MRQRILTAFFLLAFFASLLTGVLPRTFPTDHTSFSWGMVHGVCFIISVGVGLADPTYFFVQLPNNGLLYGIGYFIGLVLLVGILVYAYWPRKSQG